MLSSHHTIIITAIFILFGPKDSMWFWLFIPFFIGGVLIDFDHCLDYYLRYRKPTFSLTELGDGLAGKEHYILPLHTIEFTLLCIGLMLFYPNIYIAYFTAGFIIHFCLDIIFNGFNGYKSLFLTYRLKNWLGIVCLNTD
jgi:hypothetical protein